MKRGNARRNATQSQSTEHKKMVCCRNCKHAALIQYGDNPVLAQCLMKPDRYNDRFPYDVDVASSLKYCAMYQVADIEKTVEKRIQVRHHPMAAYVKSNSVA